MGFKEYFKLFSEELKVDRTRKVKKAFNKLAKKKNIPKFKPQTFGFDIEFDYQEDPDIIDEWTDYIKTRMNWDRKFYDWLGSEQGECEPMSLDDWTEDNPEPEKVLPMDEPLAENYVSQQEYDDAMEIWRDHQAEYEQYVADLEEWQENYDAQEQQISEWEDNLDDWWKQFAEETQGEAYDYLDVTTSDQKLDYYESILEDLGENTQREGNGDNDYKNNWILSLDGGEGHPPEIASRILTTKDFPVVKQLLRRLRGEKTSNGTSAHIHIGLPADFDAFSVLTLFQLVDEKTIQGKLPDRLFGDFAQFSEQTTKKIEGILRPIIQNGESIWKKTVKETGESRLVSHNSKERQELQTISIYMDERGKIDRSSSANAEKELTEFLTLLKNKDIKIIQRNRPYSVYKKRLGRPGPDGIAGYRSITYKYVNPDKDPVDWQPIPINKDKNNYHILDSQVVNYILNAVVNKFSGVNFSYYNERKTIEFRYLSSQILEDPDEFLMFINYFLFIPSVAQKARRIKLNNLELRKTDEQTIIARFI